MYGIKLVHSEGVIAHNRSLKCTFKRPVKKGTSRGYVMTPRNPYTTGTSYQQVSSNITIIFTHKGTLLDTSFFFFYQL